ncbi:MAG: hypothetical protein L0Y54_24195 [Sporichthyaceae bacterium]|nr:hypothetical protein [Sporichthyaceae bacterium]
MQRKTLSRLAVAGLAVLALSVPASAAQAQETDPEPPSGVANCTPYGYITTSGSNILFRGYSWCTAFSSNLTVQLTRNKFDGNGDKVVKTLTKTCGAYLDCRLPPSTTWQTYSDTYTASVESWCVVVFLTGTYIPYKTAHTCIYH